MPRWNHHRRREEDEETTPFRVLSAYRGDWSADRLTMANRVRMSGRDPEGMFRDWARHILKSYRRAVRKVEAGEWSGIPRKTRREVWRTLNGQLRDPNGYRVEPSPRARAMLIDIAMQAAQIDYRRSIGFASHGHRR